VKDVGHEEKRGRRGIGLEMKHQTFEDKSSLILK
jgi:hypothetical protein